MENMLTPSHIIRIIDHTYLKTEKEGDNSSEQERKVRQLVYEAHEAGAFGVCVRETQVKLARTLIKELESSLKVISVIGFPRGDDYSTQEKIELLMKAMEDGADEFDIVFNYQGFLKGHADQVRMDVERISTATKNLVLKVIFENCCLPDDRKSEAYELVKTAFADSYAPPHRRFFKTSTGFAQVSGRPIGATLKDALLMKKVAGESIGIKPSGGISDFETARQYFEVLGCPWNETQNGIDAYKFRIGSSGLLQNLTGTASNSQSSQTY